jgi:nicotinamide mononucleotide (NMN) deamidase PncC
MSDMVISTGIPDSQLYLQAVANVDAPYSVEPKSGDYPLVGNVLVNRKLANRWLAVNLASRAFVDGMGVTSVGAEAENVGFLRFPLLMLPPRLKRTLATKLCPADDGKNGTPGNNKPFNENLPHGLQTDGYDMKFVQEYDEAAQVSRVNMRMIGADLDLLGQHTSYIPKTVGLLQDGDVLAAQIGSALAHASKNSNANIIAYDPSNTDDGYVQGIMNKLASALSNVRGSYKEGIISYDRNKSVYVMRWSFFNKLMTIKNGALVNSDVAQKILLNGYLDDSGERLLGSYIYGKYMGIYIKVLPDELFDTAAATLNLTKEQYLQWNKVVAYIANADGTLFGMSANVTDVDKSPTTSLGYIIRNDWGWGVEVIRPSSIALVVETGNNLADFNNPVTEFNGINSPANMESIIEEYQSADNTQLTGVNEKTVQRIGVTSPTLVTEVTLTVNGTGDAKVNNAEVVVRGEGGVYSTVANHEDGTYTFTLPKASTATIVISAEGYQNGSATISVTDTATATLAKTVALTATAKSSK